MEEEEEEDEQDESRRRRRHRYEVKRGATVVQKAVRANCCRPLMLDPRSWHLSYHSLVSVVIEQTCPKGLQ